MELELDKKGIKVSEVIKAQLGNGNKIHFWPENWCGKGILKNRFPTLFKLEKKKRSSIAERIKEGERGITYIGKWNKGVSSQNAIKDLGDLIEMLQSIKFEKKEDTWIWEWESEIGFSVKSVRKHLVSNIAPINRKIFPWNGWIPIKINVFRWRALLNRLPTKVALIKRGVNMGSTLCTMCGEVEESLVHLLTGCRVAQSIWTEIESWCGITPLLAFAVEDLIYFHNNVNGSFKRKQMIKW